MDANAIVDAIMIVIVDAIMMRMRMWMRLKDQRIRIQAAARYVLASLVGPSIERERQRQTHTQRKSASEHETTRATPRLRDLLSSPQKISINASLLEGLSVCPFFVCWLIIFLTAINAVIAMRQIP